MRHTLLLLVLLPHLAARADEGFLPVETVEAESLRRHCVRLREGLKSLGDVFPGRIPGELEALLARPTLNPREVQQLLDPLCLLGVEINPESRVKTRRGPAEARLLRGKPGYFLVKVHNDAGVTHRLTVRASQAPGPWLVTRTLAPPPLAEKLGGHTLEYVILVLTPREGGKREATFQVDVGQGTQDLGFRAETPILFRIGDR